MYLAQNQGGWLPVIFVSKDDYVTPIMQITSGAVTCGYQKNGSTLIYKEVNDLNWVEGTLGLYSIHFDASDSDVAGQFSYVVANEQCLPYYGSTNCESSQFGLGQVAWSHTVTKPDEVTPISGVRVIVTTDRLGFNIIAGPQYTGIDGVVTFYLNPGVYYFRHYHPKYVFGDDPDEEEVS